MDSLSRHLGKKRAPAYKYKPLAASEIRILELQPSWRASGRVRCQLRHVGLGGKPAYEAVSYSWGAEAADQEIEVDGCALGVTPTLRAALLRFRALGARRLWIDAVCINQADLVERGAQVRLMRAIYGGCARLLVWLGNGSEETDYAMRLVERYSRSERDREAVVGALRLGEEHSPALVRALSALIQLFSRSWFRRTWVMQEYGLTGNSPTVFICGGVSVSDEDMTNATMGADSLVRLADAPAQRVLHRIASLKSYTELDRDAELLAKAADVKVASDHFLDLVSLRLGYSGGLVNKPETQLEFHYQMKHLLETARVKEATEPRDKVFAILGFLDTSEEDRRFKFPVQLDYEISVEDVYSNIVKGLISVTSRLEILRSCSVTNGPLISRTWTPDWTTPLRYDYHKEPPNAKETAFDAARKSDCIAVCAEDLSTLTCRGFVWDIVARKFTFISADDVEFEAPDIAPIQDTCRHIYATMAENPAYDSEEGIKLALWRSLTVCSEPSDWTHIAIDDLLGNAHDNREGICRDDENQIVKQVAGRVLSIASALEDHFIVATNRGYIGQTFRNVQAGDIVCILLGCSMPMVLRPIDNHFELIGDIYLDGIMYGEAMAALDERKFKLQDFELH